MTWLPENSDVWSADVPPSSPSPLDDEFPPGPLNPKWSIFNNDASMTASIGGPGLILEQTANPGHHVCGIYQPKPVTPEWSMTAKLSIGYQYSAVGVGVWGGIFMAQDIPGNPLTTPLLLSNIVNNDAGATGGQLFGNWQTFTSNWVAPRGNGRSVAGYMPIYTRIRWQNGAPNIYSVDYSGDGIAWVEQTLNATDFQSPAQVGLFINNYTHGFGLTHRVYVHWIRFGTSYNRLQTSQGGYL